jgi:hypothetical protein
MAQAKRRTRAGNVKLDAKTIAAVAALVTAIAGGVELRVQVGMLASKVDRIERIIEDRAATAQN